MNFLFISSIFLLASGLAVPSQLERNQKDSKLADYLKRLPRQPQYQIPKDPSIKTV
jgi:hypothetical protein